MLDRENGLNELFVVGHNVIFARYDKIERTMHSDTIDVLVVESSINFQGKHGTLLCQL